ncbi:unnamed protein product [Amaranthus hypochondriacus]
MQAPTFNPKLIEVRIEVQRRSISLIFEYGLLHNTHLLPRVWTAAQHTSAGLFPSRCCCCCPQVQVWQADHHTCSCWLMLYWAVLSAALWASLGDGLGCFRYCQILRIEVSMLP